jgi:peroxiredoxin family protein
MWTIIYTNDQHVTSDTYVLNLQYKITHRILACNKTLHTWKIKQSKDCDNCKEVDTIEHFLVQWNDTYTMWQHIFNWWAANMELGSS